jgi:hypothetical protein
MHFTTKIAIVVADDLASWQKLNVVSFLTSGVIGATENLIGQPYIDASQCRYLPLCIQPVIILQAPRAKLNLMLTRANRREIPVAVFIEDMFRTEHDSANRATVTQYQSEALPLVGMAIRAEAKAVDKVVKGAKLHP